MANLQDIRRRIRSVKSIQQITNAMDMVATSRLRHFPSTSCLPPYKQGGSLAASAPIYDLIFGN